MPTPTLGYENVARIQPKKRLPAADGGQCLSIYFFSGTSELGPHERTLITDERSGRWTFVFPKPAATRQTT